LMIFAKNMLTQVNSGQYYFPSGSLLLNWVNLIFQENKYIRCLEVSKCWTPVL
jgi:hypothetical protein